MIEVKGLSTLKLLSLQDGGENSMTADDISSKGL